MAKIKKTKAGTELPLMSLKGKDYLEVKYRLVWFREEHPQGTISTSVVKLEADHAIVNAQISIGTDRGRILLASAHKMETKAGFGDFLEKAETGAIGRALAMAGYGTQFDPELEEGERIVDAPAEVVRRPSPVSASLAAPAPSTNVARDVLLKNVSTASDWLVKSGVMPVDKQIAHLKDKYGAAKKEDLSDEQLSELVKHLQGMLK